MGRPHLSLFQLILKEGSVGVDRGKEDDQHATSPKQWELSLASPLHASLRDCDLSDALVQVVFASIGFVGREGA